MACLGKDAGGIVGDFEMGVVKGVLISLEVCPSSPSLPASWLSTLDQQRKGWVKGERECGWRGR